MLERIQPSVDELIARAERIAALLGWAPRYSFEAGLRNTVSWYLEHRDWCEQVQAGRYDRTRLGLG